MRLEDMDYGHYYTVRGLEHIELTFWHDNSSWWLEETYENGVSALYRPRGDVLIEYDVQGNERGPVVWRLDDVIGNYPDAAIDATARHLLADVDI